jgi:hypothetical protein
MDWLSRVAKLRSRTKFYSAHVVSSSGERKLFEFIVSSLRSCQAAPQIVLVDEFSRGGSSDVSKIEAGNSRHLEHRKISPKPQIAEFALKGLISDAGTGYKGVGNGRRMYPPTDWIGINRGVTHGLSQE